LWNPDLTGIIKLWYLPNKITTYSFYAMGDQCMSNSYILFPNIEGLLNWYQALIFLIKLRFSQSMFQTTNLFLPGMIEGPIIHLTLLNIRKKVSSINPDPHIRCIGIRFKNFKYFLINIIMGCSHIGKHPQEELTKFGYR
jgi:hypothetical protein